MSWSLEGQASETVTAAEALGKLVQECPHIPDGLKPSIYVATDVMRHAFELNGGTVKALRTNGHINPDGSGSYGVAVSSA